MQKYLTPKFVIPAAILGVVGLALVWWLASPLFINQSVNEAAPVIAAQTADTASATSDAMAQTADTAPAPSDAMAKTVDTAPADQAQVSNDAMPAEKPGVVREGSFYNVVHDGSGMAQIIRLEDGSQVLRFDNFQVLNGPDLYVYLTSAEKIDAGIGGDLPNVLNLGKLKGNLGAQNYVLPADVDLSEYNSVVIWCQAFHVPFAAAPLV